MLTNISRRGDWVSSANDINSNFKALGEFLEGLGREVKKGKGLFPSVEKLESMYPTGEDGIWAYVGESFPAEIYLYTTNGWIPTGYVSSGDPRFNPSQITMAEEMDYPVSYLVTSRAEWICSSDGENWVQLNNGMILVDPDDVQYTFRPNSVKYGEEGELLEQTTTDPYLWEFLVGTEARFVSMTITSSDNVRKVFENGNLSWIIDDSYYYRVISGKQYPRVPVSGDYFRIEFVFINLAGEEKKLSTTFKFVE